MLFLTRKRFEEEVQKRLYEEHDKRETYRRIDHVSERMYELESEVRHLKGLLGADKLEKESTATANEIRPL